MSYCFVKWWYERKYSEIGSHCHFIQRHRDVKMSLAVQTDLTNESREYNSALYFMEEDKTIVHYDFWNY